MADENVQHSEELIQEARSLGWMPKDEFKGKEEHWVDADEYVERGRKVLPILTENNKRLMANQSRMEQEITSLGSALRAATVTIKTLEESHEEDTKQQVAEAKEALRKELEAASRDGDHAAVAVITEKISDLASANAAADAEAVAKKKREEDLAAGSGRRQADPELLQWYKDNPDFVGDRRRVALGTTIAQELREGGERSTGKVFMDLVQAEVEKVMGTPAGRPSAGKVEAGGGGSARSGNGGDKGGKTYADLPAEAKAACDRQAARVVGQNRAHKDQASWRKSYVKQYFAEE